MSLTLNGAPNVTSDGLAHLARLPRLEWLEIRDARRISDAGLVHLHSVSSLRRLEVSKGQFSAAAISAFRTALPECEVLLREETAATLPM